MTGLLQTYLSDSAARDPEAIAVVHDEQRVSYAELERRTNRLARALREAGCQRQDRVAIAAPKSIEAIVSILATLKANCVYVPLDLGSPAARLARILSDCEPRVILTTHAALGGLKGALPETGAMGPVIGCADDAGAERANVAFDERDLAALDDSAPKPAGQPDDLAYIFFTSGSTGAPKGVMVEHSNVSRFVEWANAYFGTEPRERVSGVFPLQFDLSVYDLFGALAAGAELHLIGPEMTILPNRLAEYIRERRLTQWFCVPSLMTYMARLNAIRPNDFPALRRVLWCGEVLPTPTLMHWMKSLRHVQFTNLYGPTEATIASSYYTIPEPPVRECDSIPIGRACDGEELIVLNESGQPAGIGELGELCIGGAGLARGYWRDPSKTTAAFIADPRNSKNRLYRTGDLARRGDDGLFYFVGRRDSQIKSRGYRIELGEIESALNSLGVLDDCAIVAIESGGFEGWIICCAFVPHNAATTNAQTLRTDLARHVPNYMLPTRWRSYASLPRNGSGKVDRKAIRDEFQAAAPARR